MVPEGSDAGTIKCLGEVHNQYISELYSMLYPNFSKLKVAAQLISIGKGRANVTVQKDRRRNLSL